MLEMVSTVVSLKPPRVSMERCRQPGTQPRVQQIFALPPPAERGLDFQQQTGWLTVDM